MSKRERQAADFVPGDNAYARTGVGATTRYEIPSEMVGKFCLFTNETGATMYVRFGVGTVAVDDTEASGLAGETLTAGGSAPHLVVFGSQTVRVGVPSGATHMALKGGTSGSWRFGLATGVDGDAG